MGGVMTTDQLRKLEVAKRRALWALAELKPGDPAAVKVLVELDEVDQPARRKRTAPMFGLTSPRRSRH